MLSHGVRLREGRAGGGRQQAGSLDLCSALRLHPTFQPRLLAPAFPPSSSASSSSSTASLTSSQLGGSFESLALSSSLSSSYNPIVPPPSPASALSSSSPPLSSPPLLAASPLSSPSPLPSSPSPTPSSSQVLVAGGSSNGGHGSNRNGVHGDSHGHGQVSASALAAGASILSTMRAAAALEAQVPKQPFVGLSANSLRCLTCGHQSPVRNDSFTSLSLALPFDRAVLPLPSPLFSSSVFCFLFFFFIVPPSLPDLSLPLLPSCETMRGVIVDHTRGLSVELCEAAARGRCPLSTLYALPFFCAPFLRVPSSPFPFSP